ncbi:NB-ARC domain-containing protein [uncultured Acetatifactor sp.]|uniref:protein kinase domain-containing protein n=1 Tax=uncultured Acetatifactor sp. TaxID=1671927 RepID=UPI0026177DCA|nr:NB-ARC domain-containing protein [uncultured Acetatifactor sp.]
MEDTRIALKEGTLLSVSNREKGAVTYTIGKVKGRGMSGIVYDASYLDNRGYRHAVLIKECYPFEADIYRDGDRLVPGSELDERIFRECRSEMEASYGLHNELFHTSGLTNYISNTIDNYTENNTIYTVLTYQEGEVLSRRRMESIKECVSVVKSVAAFLGRMHEKGYLYLDVKPENILLLEGSPHAVQLFDFDTPIRLSDIRKSRNREEGGSGRINRLACTKGFAAYEQKKGYLHNMGRHTDVYGVGALLFWLLFGRVPEAPDCETGAEYKFADCMFADRNYQDRLFRALPDFFHHTLTDFGPGRYQDMDQVIRKLEEIERYADTIVPFVISSQVNRPPVLLGREREMKALEQWLDADKTNCLFLTGMGGMGKSTLVRGYIADHRSRFDAVLYLYYNGSIQKMITDDSQLRVNIVEKTMEESTSDYFYRKLRVLRDLAAGRRILLVVDNFDGEPDEDFSAILDIGWKVIVVSRLEIPKTGYATLALKAISDRADLYDLFERYVGRDLDDEELNCVDEMIHRVFGHTLALQLIARQVACSHISVSQATALLREKGFSDIAPEKVDYVKDWRLYQDTVADIIGVIFQAGEMEERKKALLKALSMFSVAGIGINTFSHMLSLDTKDPINELAREGWVETWAGMVSLHPVVREVIRRWEWTELDQNVCSLVAYGIWKQIVIEAEKEHSRKWIQDMQMMKARMEEDPECDRAVREYVDGLGAEGDIFLERIAKSDQRQVTDYQELSAWLNIAEEILDYYRKEPGLQKTNLYYALLYQSFMNVPLDREDYILKHAREWLSALSEDDWKQMLGKDVLEAYDRIITIYGERKDYETAYSELKNAEMVAQRFHSHYSKGLYYMILAGYYDYITDWYYGRNAQTGNIRKQNDAIDKAIWHLKRDTVDESKALYIRALLSKAHLLTLSYPGMYKKIIRLLDTAKRTAEEYVQQDSDVWLSYYIVSAWFDTLIGEDFELMELNMAIAKEIAQVVLGSDLGRVNGLLLPWFNMLIELKEYEKAAEKLIEGIRLCEKDAYKSVVPYIRKKVDLYTCLLDTYYLKGDFEKCREVLGVIDEENRRNRELGVVKVIEEGYREEILRG